MSRMDGWVAHSELEPEEHCQRNVWLRWCEAGPIFAPFHGTEWATLALADVLVRDDRVGDFFLFPLCCTFIPPLPLLSSLAHTWALICTKEAVCWATSLTRHSTGRLSIHTNKKLHWFTPRPTNLRNRTPLSIIIPRANGAGFLTTHTVTHTVPTGHLNTFGDAKSREEHQKHVLPQQVQQ